MALPTGAISLADLQSQLGGANPISLSEYYVGGPYTKAGIVAPSGPIASSGSINLNSFRGAYFVPIVLNLLWVDNNSAIKATNPATIAGQGTGAGSNYSNDAVGLSGIGHYLSYTASGGVPPFTHVWTITPGNFPASTYGWWWGSQPNGTNPVAYGTLTNTVQTNIFPIVRGTDSSAPDNGSNETYNATLTVTLTVTDSAGQVATRSVAITTSMPYAGPSGGNVNDGN